MTTNSKFEIQNSKLKPAALLWDESFLWGLMAYRALTANGLLFDLIRSEDVRNGGLKKYSLLFVPGGWASNKIKALGDAGVSEIKAFVREGGAYLGFCGGAGLATMDGMELLPVKRRATKDRVPSFSGRIRLDTCDHALWQGISDPVFNAWWPSQFVIDESVSVLAAYGSALPDSFSSDINVGDVEANGNWAELERFYQINLDPKRLLGEPAVIEGRFGMGKVLLSLVHFDSPDDKNGAIALKNLWRYLIGECGTDNSGFRINDKKSAVSCIMHDVPISEPIPATSGIGPAVDELINLGERNFLWYWRNPMLLQWRRGVRGLEYCTLYIMVKEILRLLSREDLERIGRESDISLELVIKFVDKAKKLLLLERYAMQGAHITYERCDVPEIQALREELFSRSKSHGGVFKEMIGHVDRLLYAALSATGGKRVNEGKNKNHTGQLPGM